MTLDPALVSEYQQTQATLLDRHALAAESRSLTLSDPPTQIHVIEAGAGDPLVFIHGGAGVGAEFVPFAARFASKHRVIVPDRPGHGLSDSCDVRAVDLRRLNVNFVKALLDGLAIERADIVSSAFGSFVALCFAIEHPERVGRHAILGSFPGFGTQVSPVLRILGTPILGSLIAAMGRPSLEGTRANFGRVQVTHIDRVPEELIALHTLHARMHGRDIARLFRAAVTPFGWRRRYDLTKDLASMRVPTLLAWGDHDGMWPIAHAEQIARAIPNARLTVVADAGHMPWLDQMEPFVEIVGAFLAGEQSSGSAAVAEGEVRTS